MKKAILFLIALLLLYFAVLSVSVYALGEGNASADKEAIKKAALDYIEGWYDGNAERMERALHPDLAKRGVFVNEKTGKIAMRSVGAADMVKYTKAGAGKGPEKKEKVELTLLDMYKNTACVKIVSPDFVDYLQLARYKDGWAIVNVLWEMNK
ncbi:nuclear transport factor 2 family protein [Acidobacteriota bacterium]